MKTTVKIPKSRLEAPVDFGEVLKNRYAAGVALSYTEYGFIQLDSNKAVLFDAYSASHRYRPLDVECGIVAFPFYCGCMTDGGERVAYCGLRFNDERAVRWKPIGIERVLGRLAVDEYAAAVPLSSGVCCISDEAGYNLFCSHMMDDVHPLAGLIVLNGQTHACVELFGKKFGVFSTGWGDGRYKCYAGLTETGRVTAIIVDFGMIEYPATDDRLVDVEVEPEEIYDPNKSESENNIARWTRVIEGTDEAEQRMSAFARRGYAYHSVNKTDEALDDYLSAIACAKHVDAKIKKRGIWSVYDNAAEIYMERSDYESAINLMTDSLAVNDDFYTGAYVRLIDLYQLTKRTDKALEIAGLMLEKRDGDPVAHMKYAECCVAAMDYERAAREYGELANRFKLYENLFDQASCLIELGDYKGAELVLDSHPAKELYEQYWHYKAYLEFKKHNPVEANVYALKAHEIDGEYMPALYLLIDIATVLQKYHAVAMYAEEYKRLRPDNEYGYSVCAEAHMMLGNLSECAKNLFYLYERIKQDDKYAALAAVTGYKAGDRSRAKRLLRMLRRKRSKYYHGAMYCIRINRYKDRSDIPSEIGQKLKDDGEFLILLSVFLLRTNYLIPATQLVGLVADEDPSFESLAQQIRVAERINDKKRFFSFFDYYVNKYVSTDLPQSDLYELAERFMSSPQRHRGWLTQLRKPNG